MWRVVIHGYSLFWVFGDFRCGALLFMVIHCFGSLVILDVARCYWFFTLYINIKIGKKIC